MFLGVLRVQSLPRVFYPIEGKCFCIEVLELRVSVLVLFARFLSFLEVLLNSGSFVRFQGQCLELLYLSAEVQLEGCLYRNLAHFSSSSI